MNSVAVPMYVQLISGRGEFSRDGIKIFIFESSWEIISLSRFLFWLLFRSDKSSLGNALGGRCFRQLRGRFLIYQKHTLVLHNHETLI